MMKKRLRPRTWIVLAAAALIALVCTWWTALGGSDVVLPQAELQQKIDARLPYVTTYGLTIGKADIDLTGDKLGLAVQASAPLGHTTYSLNAKTRGRLSYNNSTGEFFFHPESLEVVNVESFKGTLQGTSSNVLSNLGVVQKWHQKKDDALTGVAQRMQGTVEKAAAAALDRVPVYKLKNDLKGNVAFMALSSVEVKNGAIVAHMSFLHFTGYALLYLGVFALVILMSVGFVVAAANGAELPFFFIV